MDDLGRSFPRERQFWELEDAGSNPVRCATFWFPPDPAAVPGAAGSGRHTPERQRDQRRKGGENDGRTRACRTVGIAFSNGRKSRRGFYATGARDSRTPRHSRGGVGASGHSRPSSRGGIGARGYSRPSSRGRHPTGYPTEPSLGASRRISSRGLGGVRGIASRSNRARLAIVDRDTWR